MLAITAFAIHSWTIFNMLVDVPAWILQMNLGELTGAISYSLVYALAETFLVMAGLLAIGFLIPARVRKDNFLLWATLFFLWACGLALAVFQDPTLTFRKQWLARVFVFTYFPLAGGLSLWPALKRGLAWLAERLSLLGWLYLGLDAAGLLIVIIRNL